MYYVCFCFFFLQALTFQKINRAITAVDSQPTFDGGVLIQVLGRLQVSVCGIFVYQLLLSICIANSAIKNIHDSYVMFSISFFPVSLFVTILMLSTLLVGSCHILDRWRFTSRIYANILFEAHGSQFLYTTWHFSIGSPRSGLTCLWKSRPSHYVHFGKCSKCTKCIKRSTCSKCSKTMQTQQ